MLRYTEETTRMGMAGNVKANLEALGVNVLAHCSYPEYIIKRRFIDSRSRQMLLREDIERDMPPLKYRDYGDVDAVVISDYDKGAVTLELVDTLKYRYPTTAIYVDSKRSDLRMFKGCFLKINQHEYTKAKLPAGYNDPEYEHMIVTHGDMGAYHSGTATWFDAPDVDVFDVTGAGDVFFAALCYYRLTDRNILSAIPKAVHLASLSVQHHGIYTITKEDIDYVESLKLHAP